jgi:CheY-like chemotaxis protein
LPIRIGRGGAILAGKQQQCAHDVSLHVRNAAKLASAGYISIMPLSRVHLILVEDDDVDAEFVVRVLRSSGIGAPVTLYRDGLEALEALHGPQRAWLITRPLIILLDLSMPRLGGLEFLDMLRGDPDLKGATVFILTQSAREEDIEAAYDRQVAGYLVKSNLGEDYSLLPQLLVTYCRLVALQPRK